MKIKDTGVSLIRYSFERLVHSQEATVQSKSYSVLKKKEKKMGVGGGEVGHGLFQLCTTKREMFPTKRNTL